MTATTWLRSESHCTIRRGNTKVHKTPKNYLISSLCNRQILWK